MPIEVELPDGSVAEFPDDMGQDEIQSVLQKQVGIDETEGMANSVFLQRGIANLFGLPVDLVSAGLRKIGVPIPDAPIGGSQSIEAGFRKMGIPSPKENEAADDPSEVFFREIGAGAASLIPFVGAARMAQQAGRSGKVAQTLREAAETIGRRPVASSTIEGASIAGAGGGAAGGRAVSGDSEAAPAMEALGAIAGGLSPAAALALPSAGKLGLRAGRAAIDPFTREGSKIRAAKRVQGLTSDPSQAAENIATQADELPDAARQIPPAIRTGEKRLIGLQRRLADEDPSLERSLGRRTQAARESATDLGETRPEAGREFISQRRQQAMNRLQQAAARAQGRAEDRISKIRSDTPQADSSRIVREEIEKALGAARAEENRLWSAVPQDVNRRTAQTRQTLKSIKDQMGKLSDPEDFPAFLREGQGKIKGTESVKELQDFRSRVLREIRAERAKDAPNRTKIANLERVQEALLTDLGANPENIKKGGQALRDALDFSRTLNQRFTQGPIGRILGYERRGGPSVSGSEVLGRTVGRGGETGGEELDAIRRAVEGEDGEAAAQALNRVIRQVTEGGEPARQAISQFVRRNFTAQAINPDGTISPGAARRFMERNREVLRRMPELRQELDTAIQAGEQSTRAGQRLDRMTRQLSNKARSRMALYLDASPDRAMKRVLESSDPRKSARSLVNSAKKDESGLAVKGLKDEFVQHLFREAETGSVNEAGEKMVSGRRLRRLLNNPQVKKSASEFLNESERKRLNQIAGTLSRLEAGEGQVPSVNRAMEDLASNILEIPGRVFGAQTGSRLSSGSGPGGSLQTAQIFSSKVKDLLRSTFQDKAREILTDAVQDPELMRDLLTRPTSRAKARQVEQRLNAWLGTVAEDIPDNEFEPLTIPIEKSAQDFE